MGRFRQSLSKTGFRRRSTRFLTPHILGLFALHDGKPASVDYEQITSRTSAIPFPRKAAQPGSPIDPASALHGKVQKPA
jgi:hypothetical protein